MNAGFDMDEVYFLLGGSRLQTKESQHIAPRVLATFANAGWNTSFLKIHFANLQDPFLEGWTVSQFVEHYAKHLVHQIALSEKTARISDILKQAGVHGQKAKAVERLCEPLLGSSYTRFQILDCALEYLLGKYIPLTADASFFLEPQRVNEWIPYRGKRILNLPFQCSYTRIPTLQKRLNQLFPPYPHHTLFFHTTNWRGTGSLFESIHHTHGRKCLDFGYTPGFYMFETVDDCVEWGVKRGLLWSHEVALLVFRLPLPPPSDLELTVLERTAWNVCVQASRDCRMSDKSLLHMDRHSDFVYGPMLANVDRYAIEGPRTHSPKKMQLVSKSHKADAFLEQCLQGALVFRKPRKT